MLYSLAFIFLGGLMMGYFIEKLNLPRIIGMLISGILMGPYGLDLFDSNFLSEAASYRQMALIIILIKAGLTLNLSDLKKVGRPAILMSFLPATFEILAYLLIARKLFDLTIIEASLLGSVMAAVSPAVVVPRMVRLIEQQRGTQQGVPQLILAGASFDDIVVIVLFTSFMTMNQGQGAQFFSLLNIPFAIITGNLLGIIIGYALILIQRYFNLTLVQQTIVLLAFAFLLMRFEQLIQSHIAFSGLLSIMSITSIVKLKIKNNDSQQLSSHFGHLWTAAELVLFVLVGAAVDIRYLFDAGINAFIAILFALIIRSIGVYFSLVGTHLTKDEKIFCTMAYLPKATVQAAIGAVPLAAGLTNGTLILSFAVIGIVITAPLGAILIDHYAPRLLKNN